MQGTASVTKPKFYGLTKEVTATRMAWIATFAVLTAVGARIEIPHQPVPYTLQTFFVLLSGAVLGRKAAFLSMTTYLLLGIAGLPVFSGGGFGLARIFGPTGGYLLSFPIAAFAVGSLIPMRKEFGWVVASMLVGLLIVFTAGTIQLNLVYFQDWNTAFQAGFLIFSWWDIVKLLGASTIAYQYRKNFLKRSSPD